VLFCIGKTEEEKINATKVKSEKEKKTGIT
jgi:hypothetical protein